MIAEFQPQMTVARAKFSARFVPHESSVCKHKIPKLDFTALQNRCAHT